MNITVYNEKAAPDGAAFFHGLPRSGACVETNKKGKIMFVQPVAGREVPDPQKGNFLPAEGRSVPRNQYWLRRIADNDVIVITDSPLKGE